MWQLNKFKMIDTAIINAMILHAANNFKSYMLPGYYALASSFMCYRPIMYRSIKILDLHARMEK